MAILILIWSLFGAFGTAVNYYLVNSGFYDDIFSQAKNEIGPYPEKGTSKEQQEWNETYSFLDTLDEDFENLQQAGSHICQHSVRTDRLAFELCTAEHDGHRVQGVGRVWAAVFGIHKLLRVPVVCGDHGHSVGGESAGGGGRAGGPRR